MTSKHQILCINKNNRSSPHERIENIGGINPDGNRWNLTLDEAIRKIEDKTYAFYVKVHGDYVDVVVASRNGRKYLKTVADGDEPNNLLSLAECPV